MGVRRGRGAARLQLRGASASARGIVFALLVIASPASAVWTVECGDVYAGSGQLAADCEGDVTIDGGSLDLRGHSIRGSVRCKRDECEVYSDGGRGTISGSTGLSRATKRASVGIDAAGASLIVRNVEVSGFGTGVTANAVRAVDIAVLGNGGFGIKAVGQIELIDSTVALNGNDGLHSQLGHVRVSGSQIAGNRGNGVRALKGVTIDTTSIVWSGRDGIRNFSGNVVVDRSTVSGNGHDGVRTDDSDCFPSGTLELRTSTVEGNAVDPDCGASRTCADIAACRLARTSSSSSCGTSYRLQSGLPGESFRLCSLD
jgi:hypothetical protein